jgi:hypothetical protein
MLVGASKRDAILHCHISEESKKWLLALSDKLNRGIGDIVDEIVANAKEDAKKDAQPKKK